MEKILVAEDDRLLASAYSMKLQREGYEVEIVSDGGEVFQKLEKFTPDLIILDLLMPHMDGFLVLEYLKKNELWKNIPVIVASNLGQNDDIEKAKKLGADDFIIKTDSTMKDFAEKIKKTIENKSNGVKNS